MGYKSHTAETATVKETEKVALGTNSNVQTKL